jgi:hypothetical protein
LIVHTIGDRLVVRSAKIVVFSVNDKGADPRSNGMTCSVAQDE